jgi:hypothetical protein
MSDTLFDYERGQQLAAEGMDAAIRNAGKTWQEIATETVLTVGRLNLTFTADDVWAWFESHYLPQPPTRQALGSVLNQLSRSKQIVATGQWRNSARPETHTRPLRVWRLA